MSELDGKIAARSGTFWLKDEFLTPGRTEVNLSPPNTPHKRILG